jgi:recombination protein RecA
MASQGRAALDEDVKANTDAGSKTAFTGELASFVKAAEKLHGPTVIRSAELLPRFRHIPTNIFALDLALMGGFPESLITLLYGNPSSGKTTLAARVIGSVQAKYPDMIPVFIDVEGTFQASWAAKHGVDNKRLLLIQPETGEQALDLAIGALRAAETSLVIIDSIAALTPMKELEKSMEDLTVGEQAKLISRLSRVTQSIMVSERKRAHRPSIVWINQWRMKIGVMYGSPRTLPGGEAQHYAAALKLEMRSKEVFGKDNQGHQTVEANEHSFAIHKSKLATAIREGEFRMIRNPDSPFGAGFIDDGKTVLDWARATGHITGGGSSWKVDELDMKFSRLQDIVDYFYSDDAFFAHYKDMLIREYRVKAGLSDPNYL